MKYHRAPAARPSQLAERRLVVAVRDYEETKGTTDTAALLREIAAKIEQGKTISAMERPYAGENA